MNIGQMLTGYTVPKSLLISKVKYDDDELPVKVVKTKSIDDLLDCQREVLMDHYRKFRAATDETFICRDIVIELDMTPSAVTQMINKLIKYGFLKVNGIDESRQGRHKPRNIYQWITEPISRL